MKQRILSLTILLLAASGAFSQNVGIGTANPHASAALDITHTAKGLLIPRMSTASINTIPGPAKGLLVYDSLTNQLMVNSGTPATPNWQPIAPPANGSNPLGNIFLGQRAGLSTTTGYSNIGIGTDALRMNTINTNTIAIGDSALFSNAGPNNTAVGSKALFANTTGNGNTAMGKFALYSNTIATGNTAVGIRALYANTTGSGNVAAGFEALTNHVNGHSNIAIGTYSMYKSTASQYNVAIGQEALGDITVAQFNTAVGYSAGSLYELGYNNTFVGAYAYANQHGIFNSVAIGESAVCTGSNQVRLGNLYTSSIGGIVGYSNLSDGRYKKNIQDGVKGIDFIMKLRPVTYEMDFAGIDERMNTRKDKNDASRLAVKENEKMLFSGFIAQEVEQAAKDAGYDFSGVDKPKNDKDLYALRYAEFVVPLVKAVQEQQRTIEELTKRITELKKNKK